MRRYTDKELKNMSQEEGEKLIKELVEEQEKLGQQIRDILEGKEVDKK